MIIQENENLEKKLNFYQDSINTFSKETQKRILSEIIKKLKEDIQSNKVFFYSEEIVKEIEDKFNLIQGPLNYIQYINNSSNENPLSKSQFVSSDTNQTSSDIYINENPFHGNNEETNYGIQYSNIEKITNFDTISFDGNEENEIVDELLYSFKNCVFKKNEEEKKKLYLIL